MLGMGGSDKSQKPSDYSGRAIAQCVVEIMSAEGVEKAIVIGHDWGSIVGSRLALFYPSQVMALVLVAVPYWTPRSFALDAVNTKTEKAFGFPIFGYWDVLMNQKHLLEKHVSLRHMILRSEAYLNQANHNFTGQLFLVHHICRRP
jgi:pimeloyl-ACP methyl ester carboxylesterase